MKTSQSYLILWSLLAGGLLGLSSCSGTNLGAGLAISVTPTDAYIVQSAGPSCIDLGTIDATTGLPSQSVTGPRLFFSNFKIQWMQSDPLTVAVIRVTVVGNGITPYSNDLSTLEIQALLGQVGGIITTNNVINSNSITGRGNYPPCGLDVGGITLGAGAVPTPSIPPATTPAFSARVLIEVIGTAQASDGTVRPVKQSLYANASFID